MSSLSPCSHEEADTPMMVHVADSVSKGHQEVMIRTVDTNVVVLFIAANGSMCLHLACAGGKEENVKYFLDRGFDIEDKAEYGKTPLWMACWMGRSNVVKLLMSLGADILTTTTDGTSCLDIALKEGKAEVVEILRAAGADMENTVLVVGSHWWPKDSLSLSLNQLENAVLLAKKGHGVICTVIEETADEIVDARNHKVHLLTPQASLQGMEPDQDWLEIFPILKHHKKLR
uniref:Ankyrin repeat and KH domain-containing protein mask-like n=1 Tax=Saccoglossus kowalevskii TaxID=10224 RepID=A0ABM0MVX8_SACKO|nr:PREDICTED: ankyrin repeat and KH domain-containing protein mask-like [Saccoglossus kowalevskii]